jgi:hypothetical protein
MANGGRRGSNRPQRTRRSAQVKGIVILTSATTSNSLAGNQLDTSALLRRPRLYLAFRDQSASPSLTVPSLYWLVLDFGQTPFGKPVWSMASP